MSTVRKCCMSGVATTRRARSSQSHCAATFAEAAHVYIHVLIVIQQFFFLIFLSSSRSDQMLEDIIFKLVPGLQESEPLFLIACVCFYTFTEPVVLTTLSSLVSFFSTLPPAVHMYDSFYMCSIINTLFPRRLIFSIKHFCFRLIIPVPIVVTNFPFGKF